MATPYVTINTFLGIDNTSDKVRIAPKKGSIYLREADNVDIDDQGMLHRRLGYDQSAVFTGTGIHSVWADPTGRVCLMVHGNVLKRLPGAVWSLTTPYSLVWPIDPNDRMCYVSSGDRIYFSNNTIIGYVDYNNGLSYAFPEPTQTFKDKMTGGHILEIYKSRLYAAWDRYLIYSDSTVLGQKDTRKNTIPFERRITMVKAVNDGVYVGVANTFDDTGNQVYGAVYFMNGNDPNDFTQVRVSDEGPIEGMSVVVDGDDIGRGALGKVVYWVTKCGVYKGYPGGVVTEMQDGLFTPSDVSIGTAIYTYRNGYSQFLAIGQLS